MGEIRAIDQETQPDLHHHGGAGAEQANSALGTEELQKKKVSVLVLKC